MRHRTPLGRSLRTYYASGSAERLDRFYVRFLSKGELGFDIGAHVGDRTASWRRIGARVVAVEPQPDLFRLLRKLFGNDAEVDRVQSLIGCKIGRARLLLNSANLSVATASASFVAAATGAQGWEDQVWDKAIDALVTTLDVLAAEYGQPDFIKLDVEGFEAKALAGLATPPRSLSFEFTTIQRGVAMACLKRAAELGYFAFNSVVGEELNFVNSMPLDINAMSEWIDTLPLDANSGDVYASLEPVRLQR